MDHIEGPINLASGVTHSIHDVVDILATHTDLTDRVLWDTTKPTGQMFRAYDVNKLNRINFQCHYTLEQGLIETYDWYAANKDQARH